ncbi:MAG: autotransporter-associated beta strand repeat-containing protein [Kiritimatiellia bacterium]
MSTRTAIIQHIRRTLLGLATLAAGARAADYTWGGGTGNWSDGNWTPGPVSGPTAGSDTATINTGTVNLNVGGMNVGTLTLGSGGTFNAYNWNGTNTYTGYGNLVLQGGVLNGSGNYHNWGAGILANTTVSGSSASTISASSFFNLNGTGGSSSVFTVADVTGDANPDLNVSAQLWDVSADTSWVAAALVKEGPGTMRITGYTGYTGGTTINGGTLDVSGANSGWGLLRGSVTVNSAGTLAITGGDGTGFGWNSPVTSLTINGGTVNASGGAHIGFGSYMTVGLSNGGTIAGSWQWNGDSLLGFSSSGDSQNTINGSLTLRSDAGPNTPSMSPMARLPSICR